MRSFWNVIVSAAELSRGRIVKVCCRQYGAVPVAGSRTGLACIAFMCRQVWKVQLYLDTEAAAGLIGLSLRSTVAAIAAILEAILSCNARGWLQRWPQRVNWVKLQPNELTADFPSKHAIKETHCVRLGPAWPLVQFPLSFTCLSHSVLAAENTFIPSSAWCTAHRSKKVFS